MLHMHDISMLMIVMDIIPNYNYCILYHFRGACLKCQRSVESVKEVLHIFVTPVVDVSEVFEIPEFDVSDVPEILDVPDVFDVPEVYPGMLFDVSEVYPEMLYLCYVIYI